MRRSPTARARGFALALAFCVLGGALGCGRETFDLLATAGAAGSFSGVSGASAGGGGGAASGAGGSFAGSEAGTGGQVSAGSAGRRSFPEGGTGGTAPCLNGPSCVAGAEGSCPRAVPFCTSCVTDKDCDGESSQCDQEKGRCYQCKDDADCATTEACNFFTGRCAKRCKAQSDCDTEADHRVCRPGIGVCVACMYSTDCGFYNSGNNKQDVCFVSECVECAADKDCTSQYCVAGRCQKPH